MRGRKTERIKEPSGGGGRGDEWMKGRMGQKKKGRKRRISIKGNEEKVKAGDGTEMGKKEKCDGGMTGLRWKGIKRERGRDGTSLGDDKWREEELERMEKELEEKEREEEMTRRET